jgi:hypothetical protein
MGKSIVIVNNNTVIITVKFHISIHLKKKKKKFTVRYIIILYTVLDPKL